LAESYVPETNRTRLPATAQQLVRETLRQGRDTQHLRPHAHVDMWPTNWFGFSLLFFFKIVTGV
jgi:hypothetical protein